VTVEDGWVTLDGEFEWNYMKGCAENAIKHALGVRGVTNRIAVKPAASPSAVKVQIEHALARRALVDADRIEVEEFGHKVVLRGSVHSWQAKEDAEQAAWSAPGVAEVEDDLTVMPTLRPAELAEEFITGG
jgi:osmotically-inducible protein OsmY